MTIIKPQKLKIGDTIGILAVSGQIKEYENILNAKKFFEKEGFNVVISETCKTSHRYMAGRNDDECVKTFHDFFENKDINAIVCARGGYGTIRLLDKINWNTVKNNPKIFAGYSDITALLCMIYKNTGLITFHSPMCNGDFASEVDEYTKNSFFNTLSGNTKKIRAINSKNFYEGSAEGYLFGGNLTVLASLCGLDFIPDKNLILFLEDLNEPVYKTDRALTQLFNIKEIKERVKGISIGEFKDVNDTQMLNTVINEFAQKIKIPVCDGFRITHNKTKDTIPLGANAIFNSSLGEISLTESYVSD